MHKLKFYLLPAVLLFSSFYGNNCIIENAPYYKYPYKSLHKELEEKDVDTIKIFSYGSLMNFDSASKTLSPASLNSYKPAIAMGVKRIFNRDVPIKPNSKWCPPNNHSARGMLNLAMSSNPQSMVNGVVFDLHRDDIPSLLYREEGYDLIPIVVKDWEDEEGKCYIAYTFYASPDSEYVSDVIDPRPKYYELCRDAAKLYGKEYYSFWLSSTYLSDGVHSIRKWEQLVQDKDPSTQTLKTNC